MRFFKRLVCYCVGHKIMRPCVDDFPKIFLPRRYETQSMSYVYSNGAVKASGVRYELLAIPYDAEARLCLRCSKLYWVRDNKKGTLCDISAIPGLTEFKELYTRFIWEQAERRKNSVADKLYKQYLVALKLGYSPDGDD